MDGTKQNKPLRRRDGSVIIHFDYDCFYASVVEAEDPALRFLPLAIQQKQIIVTCNYEARRRGLYKLQLITEAKKTCPDVIIVLGEDLTRFRNASKDLYNFLRSFSWSGKVERLGFDEVFLDMTDVVAFNYDLLNHNDLEHSFFYLSRSDLTIGFPFDATKLSGHAYSTFVDDDKDEPLTLRLILGSHLARHMRHQLEDNKGYTSSVGISTSKLLSKLVGNLHKPNSQTTLMPPYASESPERNNVNAFLGSHDVGQIPGIGFKMAQKIRHHVLQRPAEFDDGLVYGGTKEKVSVNDVVCHPGLSADVLEKLLAGSGAPHGIGTRIFALLHGVDDAEVGQARDVPKQISIEDSYLRLDTYTQVLTELHMLSKSILLRMRADLTEDDLEPTPVGDETTMTSKRWLAHPRTLRLTTRPRAAPNPDGSRSRSFARISRSGPLPNFVFSLTADVNSLADKLVQEALIPLFRKLHPEKLGWNLSLVNVAVTDMVDAAGTGKTSSGRDIGKMFRHQHDNLLPWTVQDEHRRPDSVPTDTGVSLRFTPGAPPGETTAPQKSQANGDAANVPARATTLEVISADPFDRPGPQPVDVSASSLQPGSEDLLPLSSQGTWTSSGGGGNEPMEWDVDESEHASTSGMECDKCGAFMPAFAMLAHERFHAMET